MSNVTYATHSEKNLRPFEDIELALTDSQIDNQATVRIDKMLKIAIEQWLKTEDAQMKGYKSIAQFINKGARQLYEIEAVQETPVHFVLPNMENHRLTLDVDIYSDHVHCNMCDNTKCIHIEILNTDSTVKKYLKKYNIKPKIK